VWITGNHDEKDGAAAGTMLPELTVGGVMLRHEARPGEPLPELSGHFHPACAWRRAAARSAGLRGDERAQADPARVRRADRRAGRGAPALLKAMQPARSITALVPTAARVAHFPLWQAAAETAPAPTYARRLFICRAVVI
jgi:hypothetical protein